MRVLKIDFTLSLLMNGRNTRSRMTQRNAGGYPAVCFCVCVGGLGEYVCVDDHAYLCLLPRLCLRFLVQASFFIRRVYLGRIARTSKMQ